ncbi:Hydroxymethylpyrimidine/phosphomethylpyrimidine kinase [Vibrio hippocampi]|uniref:hydroxymethylpyrimidine kinase n=2 Tax=Vibrio hippocampi TaxID=654686 RepID=A0ABN8DK54_9VIBR|nr:Hydroxymethylpyrimidine/phosphomethylpyrimidine kinase [Vibrio hippocampi]
MAHNGSQTSTPIVLTIAGSDSGGGAGIQADIKAISATGSYACSAITAITSQNTLGVSAIFPIPLDHVASQIDAIFSDLNVVAVKIGMLADSEIITVVAEKLKQYQPKFIVLDPVMVATSGDLLLEQSAIATLKTELIPLADIITPNLPEAAALTAYSITNGSITNGSITDSPIADNRIPKTQAEMGQMIEQLRQLGAKAVLLKGGHLEQDENSNDLLVLENDTHLLSAKRHPTQNTHGTGCTLSAAIASYLAQGQALPDAVQSAKQYITQAIQHADQLTIGQGHGPVHHFYAK